MAQFKAGDKRPDGAGRKKGQTNKVTKTVKETVLNVFLDLQQNPKTNLTAFAIKYPKDFYQLAAKLIPTELAGNIDQDITIRVIRG